MKNTCFLILTQKNIQMPNRRFYNGIKKSSALVRECFLRKQQTSRTTLFLVNVKHQTLANPPLQANPLIALSKWKRKEFSVGANLALWLNYSSIVRRPTIPTNSVMVDPRKIRLVKSVRPTDSNRFQSPFSSIQRIGKTANFPYQCTPRLQDRTASRSLCPQAR